MITSSTKPPGIACTPTRLGGTNVVGARLASGPERGQTTPKAGTSQPRSTQGPWLMLATMVCLVSATSCAGRVDASRSCPKPLTACVAALGRTAVPGMPVTLAVSAERPQVVKITPQLLRPWSGTYPFTTIRATALGAGADSLLGEHGVRLRLKAGAPVMFRFIQPLIWSRHATADSVVVHLDPTSGFGQQTDYRVAIPTRARPAFVAPTWAWLPRDGRERLTVEALRDVPAATLRVASSGRVILRHSLSLREGVGSVLLPTPRSLGLRPRDLLRVSLVAAGHVATTCIGIVVSRSEAIRRVLHGQVPCPP